MICSERQKLWLQNGCAISRRVLHAFDCKPFKLAIKSNDFGRPSQPSVLSIPQERNGAFPRLFPIPSFSSQQTAHLWVGTRPEYTIKFSPRFGFIPNSRSTFCRGFRGIPGTRACTGCLRNNGNPNALDLRFADPVNPPPPPDASVYRNSRVNTYVCPELFQFA